LLVPARVIRDHQRAELLALGEEAVNQVLKAVDLPIVYCRRDNIDVHCAMESADKTLDEDTRPAIRLIVEPRSSLNLLVVDGS
jgi:stage V sporulation protein SpoVS